MDLFLFLLFTLNGKNDNEVFIKMFTSTTCEID